MCVYVGGVANREGLTRNGGIALWLGAANQIGGARPQYKRGPVAFSGALRVCLYKQV